jgi:hypothetical protein
MKKLTIILFSLISLCFCLGVSPAYSSDWITNYYEHPTPERFVSEVRDWSKTGMLAGNKSAMLAVFLGRVMAQNRDQIVNWLTELQDLKGKDKETLLLAAYFSETAEAQSYLKGLEGTEKYRGKPRNILEIEIKDPFILDMLWFDYFATGNPASIKRIVQALNLEKYFSVANVPPTPETDEEAFTLGWTFKAAMWSLESNARQHRRIAEILETLFLDGNLTQPETVWLSTVLARAMPDKYELKVTPSEATLTRRKK